MLSKLQDNIVLGYLSMVKHAINLVILWLIFATPAYADQNIILSYGYQDQFSNNTVLDKVTFKIINDISPTWDIDFRSTYGDARNKNSTLTNFEIGARYKIKVVNGLTLYIRPELGTIKISKLPWRDYVGLELGALIRPFENKKIGFKIDHAITTGVSNEISNGTLSRFQTTYNVSDTKTIGFRYDERRGEPVEFNTINFVYGLKFKGI